MDQSFLLLTKKKKKPDAVSILCVCVPVVSLVKLHFTRFFFYEIKFQIHVLSR